MSSSTSGSVGPDSSADKKGFLAGLKAKAKVNTNGDKHTVAHGAGAEPETETENENKPQPVSFFRLFRFADSMDKWMMAVALVCSAVHGAAFPMFTVVFGDIINTFGSTTIDANVMLQKIKDSAVWFCILGVISFFTAMLQVLLFMLSGSRQAQRMRKLYIESILRQDMSWYDATNTGLLTSRVAGDVDIIAGGIGDKVGSFVQFICAFITGFIVGFAYGWQLALVILAVTPAIVLAAATFAKFMSSATTKGQEAYARAGGIAEEVLSLIRTVVAFGGEEREIARYEKELVGAYRIGTTRAHVQGLGMGITMFIIFSTYALSFWFGNKMVSEGHMSAGDVLTTFFSIIIASFSLGQAAPAVAAIAEARGAAPRVFEVIERQSLIDAFSMDGEILDSNQVRGEVEFRELEFTYPSRPDERILNKLSVAVRQGETLALVGASGCGKSTCIQLLERFYDPLAGEILLDGKELRSINVQSLRSQIGLVSQMPTLFAATIRENIELGAGFEYVVDERGNKSFQLRKVSFEEVQEAAKQANAHDFITKLPEGYDTMLGQRGALLSGGQKQRVAIARALVRRPKVLLLDEATSALDTKSERVVQEALEKAAKGRTSIVIAHRLSTIRNADKIAVVDHGRIIEYGNHDELMTIEGGRYRSMIEVQALEHQQQQEQEKEAAEGDPDAEDAAVLAQKFNEAQHRSHSDHGTTSQSEHAPAAADDEDAEPASDVDKGLFLRALKLNMSEWYILVLGTIGAAANGSTFPLFALIFSEIVVVLTQKDNESEVTFWACMFVVIAGGTLVANYLHHSMFGTSGELLTKRIRSMSFRALVQQEMAFFDEKDHSVGALSSALATEAAQVKALAGDTLGMAVMILSCVITGVVLAFTACWQLAFVVLGFVPVMGVGQALQMKLMSGFSAGSQKKYAAAGRIASETVDNIRTVTSLGLGRHFHNKYREELKGPSRDSRKSAVVSGVAFGFTEFSMFAIWAASFSFGAKLISDGHCDFLGMTKAITALLFAAMQLGQASALAPNLSEAKVAATKVFRLVDRKSEINPFDPSGTKLDKVDGNVELKEVRFEYPTRKEVPVLRKLSVFIDAGKTLALVGESGCGKSTTVALLERFYNISSGSVNVDGVDVASMNTRWLRSQMGIVSQEPDLFNTTVRENILYGLSNEEVTVVTDEAMEAAARMANAEEFIRELPQGYDTEVGERGGKLSGGQRQRIAIARALVRNPKILLLDEATSALDSKSEKVVQDALNQASQGRTTIVIAHRLSTIQHADKIAVVSRGKIVEQGTHQDLMALNGAYAQMVKNQSS